MMASSPSPSSPGGEGIPPDRAEAPGNRRGARRKGGDGVKEVSEMVKLTGRRRYHLFYVVSHEWSFFRQRLRLPFWLKYKD